MRIACKTVYLTMAEIEISCREIGIKDKSFPTFAIFSIGLKETSYYLVYLKKHPNCSLFNR